MVRMVNMDIFNALSKFYSCLGPFKKYIIILHNQFLTSFKVYQDVLFIYKYMISCYFTLCIFLVSINASTDSIKTGENFSIRCTIFGLSGLQYLNSQVTLLLRQNDSIKTTVRVWTDRSHNVTDKYGGTVNYSEDVACELRNRIWVTFDFFSKFLGQILTIKKVNWKPPQNILGNNKK